MALGMKNIFFKKQKEAFGKVKHSICFYSFIGIYLEKYHYNAI